LEVTYSIVAGSNGQEEMPASLWKIRKDWERCAAEKAAERKMKTCLALNRRDSLWFDEEENLPSR
jgi:hypothetical protein